MTENNSTVQESIESDESEQPKVATRVRFTNNPFAVFMDDNDDDEEEDDAEDASMAPQAQVATRSGRTIRQPARLIEEMGMAELDSILAEYTLVGADIGGSFNNTEELRVMNFKRAMASNDKAKWMAAIKEKHDHMPKNNVWKAVIVKKFNIPQDAKILTSTCGMKKKADGTYRARMVAPGYELIDGWNQNTTRSVFKLYLPVYID